MYRADYLIVGQGLAGSLIAYELDKRAMSSVLIDPNLTNSSKVAAGLYNPITGKNRVKTWMFDSLFPFMNTYYSEMETSLACKLLYPQDILLLLDSVETQNDWVLKSSSPVYSDFVKLLFHIEKYETILTKHEGALLIKEGGHVDIPVLLAAIREKWIKKANYIEKVCDYTKIELNNLGVYYDSELYKGIIFCEGYQSVKNPWFGYLPVVPNKGEVFDIFSENLPENHIISKNGFVLPKTNGNFRVGSTYYRNETENIPSQKGHDELIDKIDNLLNIDYQVINHKAGIRPTTIDTRPIMGSHSEFKQLAVFNGLGAKGVSIAPYFVNAFVDNLLHDKPLPKDVSIERCAKYKNKK